LGFSVAFHATPDVLLIDEALGVGDQDFRIKSKQAIKETIKSNRTVVLVSHDMNSVLELCDRVVWIDDGTTRLVGAPEEVVSNYNDHFRNASKGTLRA
jgi:lipopolysaccharide transport system ATP-binding protein